MKFSKGLTLVSSLVLCGGMGAANAVPIKTALGIVIDASGSISLEE